MGVTIVAGGRAGGLDGRSDVAAARSLEQRMEALAKANRVRTQRKELKHDAKHRRVSVHNVLVDPPEFVETMKVFDLLIAAPKVGRVKANRWLKTAAISPSKTVGGLSVRQRSELCALLRGVR
jgi:hypothetical protein